MRAGKRSVWPLLCKICRHQGSQLYLRLVVGFRKISKVLLYERRPQNKGCASVVRIALVDHEDKRQRLESIKKKEQSHRNSLRYLQTAKLVRKGMQMVKKSPRKW